MKYLLYIIVVFSFVACNEETPIPKPPTYLRLELPEHSYSWCDNSEWYRFKIDKQYEFKITDNAFDSSQKAVIDLGPLNGSVYLHYWKMTRPLSYYINNANDEVDRHKIKADKISDERIIRPEAKVFGTLFKLQGDVATPYQFYLTDSNDRFIYAEVLFNTRPNYDSLKPTLDYVDTDLKTFVESIEWKQK